MHLGCPVIYRNWKEQIDDISQLLQTTAKFLQRPTTTAAHVVYTCKVFLCSNTYKTMLVHLLEIDFLNIDWAVGLTYWIVYLHFFVLWQMQLYMSWYIISFFGFIFTS